MRTRENGDNYWKEEKMYKHSYLMLKKDGREMAGMIENMMLNLF